MILLVKGRPLGSERVKGNFCFAMIKENVVASWFVRSTPSTRKSDLIDFTLSNARWFYSKKGDPLGVKGLKNYLP